MVEIALKIQILPEKPRDLMQTLEAIMGKTLAMKNCVSLAHHQGSERLNDITLLMAWGSQEPFRDYQKSHHFGVLPGAFNLLCASRKMPYDIGKK